MVEVERLICALLADVPICEMAVRGADDLLVACAKFSAVGKPMEMDGPK